MPPDRLALILVVVMAAAGATIWAASLLLTRFTLTPAAGLIAAMPIGLVAYIAFRIITDRVGKKEGDRYDRPDT